LDGTGLLFLLNTVAAKGNVTFWKWYLSSSVYSLRNTLTTSLNGVTSQKRRIFN